MNTKTYLSIAGAFLLAATAAQATLIYGGASYTGAIPDANPAGISSTIAVSGAAINTVRDVNVTLNLSGGYNGDLYGYLLGPDGSFAVLLNRIGRTSDTGLAAFGNSGTSMVITLDDNLNPDIHAAASGALSGSYASDGRNVNPLNALGTDARTHRLDDIFAEASNRTVNGTWTLFLADMSGANTMTLNSWSLDITAVPEPATWALMIFGALACGTVAVRRFRRQAA
jgi:subtilisin-like proprotein convertase family protein